MELKGRVAVVTGGGSGIGRALCRRFAAEGAKAVVVADMNPATATQVADEIGGTAITCHVPREADVIALVTATIAQHGRIGLCCSSARTAPKPKRRGDRSCSTRPWNRSRWRTMW